MLTAPSWATSLLMSWGDGMGTGCIHPNWWTPWQPHPCLAQMKTRISWLRSRSSAGSQPSEAASLQQATASRPEAFLNLQKWWLILQGPHFTVIHTVFEFIHFSYSPSNFCFIYFHTHIFYTNETFWHGTWFCFYEVCCHMSILCTFKLIQYNPKFTFDCVRVWRVANARQSVFSLNMG